MAAPALLTARASLATPSSPHRPPDEATPLLVRMMSMTSPFLQEEVVAPSHAAAPAPAPAVNTTPPTGVAAAAPAPPHTSWWSMLRQEVRREERWSWLPRPSRRQLVNFKGQDNEMPSTAFVAFRAGVLLYWSAWVSVAVAGVSKGVHLPAPLYEYLDYGVLWLIYATNWTAMLLWAYLALAFVAMAVAAQDRRRESTARWVGLGGWVLRDTVAPAAVMVMLLYWALLFPADPHTNFVDAHLHVINALIILADLWLSRMPFWLLHFPAPLAFLWTYIVFAGVYYAAGGKAPERNDYIYPFLNFGRLGLTIPLIFVVVFVIFPVVHASLWAFERKARQRALRRQPKGEMSIAAEEKGETKVEDKDEEEAFLELDTNQETESKEADRAERPRLFLGSGTSEGRRQLGGGWLPRWPRGVRSVTDDELRRLREDLLIGEGEETEAAAEEEEGAPRWQRYEDAETF